MSADDAKLDALQRWGNLDYDEIGRKSGWFPRDDGYWTPWHLAAAAIADAQRKIAELEHAQERAFGALAIEGVPKERARSVDNGIGVLAQRWNKYQHAAEAERDALREQVQALTAAIDEHHDQDCQQMRGPYGEQWRESHRICSCWCKRAIDAARQPRAEDNNESTPWRGE